MATIIITGPVEVRDEETSQEITDPQRLKACDGAQERGVKMANDLDGELAYLGIAGGDLKLRYDEKAGQLLVVSKYQAPEMLSPQQLQTLVEHTRDQWSDGAGEGAFCKLMDKHGISFDLTPSGSEQQTRIEQNDKGGRSLKPTPELMIAAAMGDTATIKRLLASGVDPSTSGPEGSALHLAILKGHPDAAALLIEAGANVNSEDYDSPLRTAATTSDLATAQLLIAAGADVNRADPEGRTPLMWAANRASEPIVKLLLEHGADPNAKDHVEHNEGGTPLSYTQNRDRNIRDLLIAYGAKAPPPKPSALQQALDQAALCEQSGNTAQAAHWRQLAEQLQKFTK
jgi:hypothetical protein